MGGAPSQSANMGKVYSDREIDQNIQKLFSTNKLNQFSEASIALNEFLTETAKQSGGGGIKFNSSKKRYLRHNIDQYLANLEQPQQQQQEQYQAGGEKVFTEQSDELDKINDFLQNDMTMTGGSCNSCGCGAGSTPVSDYASKNKVTLYDVLFKRGQFGGDDSDATDDSSSSSPKKEKPGLNNDDDSSSNSSSSSSGEEDFSPEEEEEGDTNKTPTPEARSPARMKRTKKASPKRKQRKLSRTPSDNQLSSTSSSAVSLGSKQVSSTSYSQRSSSYNNKIIPFYSSDSSVSHPYNKSRLNV